MVIHPILIPWMIWNAWNVCSRRNVRITGGPNPGRQTFHRLVPTLYRRYSLRSH